MFAARLPFGSTKNLKLRQKNFIRKIQGNPLPESCAMLFITLCTGWILKKRTIKLVFSQKCQTSNILIFYISEWGVPSNGIFRPCVRWVREVGRFRELFTYPRVRLSVFLQKSMVSCKRGTHFSEKYGFVQEGHTSLEKVWFRARWGTHFLKKYGFVQEAHTILEKVWFQSGFLYMFLHACSHVLCQERNFFSSRRYEEIGRASCRERV